MFGQISFLLILLIYVGVFAAAYLGVEVFRRWSLRRQIFDLPNERSLHRQPTPRGGGLVIVVVSLSLHTVYAYGFGGRFFWNYFVGAILIALVSWLDDLYTVSVGWRFTIQSLAALLIVGSFYTSVNFFGFGTGAAAIGESLAVFLWIVWMTNAYNFMDGIDGLAGLQAVTAGAGWSLAGLFAQNPTLEFYGAVLACSSLGFLIHNWQPAKVFMGDVGSAFLGYSFAVLPVLAWRRETAGDGKWILTGIALLWVFVFDTIYTLFRRALRAEKLWLPHRTHIYQQLVVAGFSHRAVSVFYGFLSAANVFLVALAFLDSGYNRALSAVLFLESIILAGLGFRFGGDSKAARADS